MSLGRSAAALALLLASGLMASCVVYTHDPATGPRTASAPRGAPPSAQTPAAPPAAAAADPAASADQPAPEPQTPPRQPPRQDGLSRLPGKLNLGAVTQLKLDVPAWSEGRPTILPEGIASGRPASFRSGAPPAYWIWQGPRGGWRLRTTTQNAPHVFRGRIKSTSSTIVNVHPSRTEYRDRIRRTSDGWIFHFRTEGHADGFTFMAQDQGCVHFDLQLDGGPVTKRVFIGQAEHEIRSGHFIICPKGYKPAGQ